MGKTRIEWSERREEDDEGNRRLCVRGIVIGGAPNSGLSVITRLTIGGPSAGAQSELQAMHEGTSKGSE